MENTEKKKLIFAGVAILAIVGFTVFRGVFAPKPEAQAEEEALPLPQTRSPRREELVFERETSRQRSFEELSPQEREEFYMKMQEEAITLAHAVAQETAQQAVADAMKAQPQTQAQAQSSGPLVSFPGASLPANVPTKWEQDAQMKKLLDKDFAAATSFFRSQIEQGRWAMSSGQFQNVLSRSNNVVRTVNSENLQLFEGKIITTETSHVIPSGTYLSAITTGFTDSDYPEHFVATMSRPSILRGWKILCRSGGNNAGRVSITPERLISPDGKEVPISGQIEMASVPGMTGQNRSRWFRRMAPSIINAGIGGGLLVWSMREEEKNREAMVLAGGPGAIGTPVGTIATPNATTTNTIIEPMIQDGIGGFQKEISRSFQQGNQNDQVKIHAGTTFDILLLSPLTIKL